MDKKDIRKKVEVRLDALEFGNLSSDEKMKLIEEITLILSFF